MAIWDEVVTEEQVLSADSDKCMNCGSSLVFDIKTNSLHCNNCGTDCYPEAFKIRRLIERPAGRKIDEDDSGFKVVNEEVVCNACGASIVAGKDTVSTVCTFCGSPALVTRRLSQEFRPDYIVPFVLEREEAKMKVSEWLEGKKNLPKDFVKKMNMTDFTPMYVPFWLVDADCVIDLVATGSVDKANYIEFYNCKRKGMFKMHNVPFDGSSKIKDHLMERIEPFDLTSVAPYSDGYLQGYYAEKYDLNAIDMADRISLRFREFISEQNAMLAYNSTDKNVHYTRFTIEENRSEATNLECKYAFLPVWFARIFYDGIYYSVAINGQTGKISGDLPDADRNIGTAVKHRAFVLKPKMVYAGIAVLAIAAIIGLYLASHFGGENGLSLYLMFFVIAIGVIPAIFAAIKKLSKSTTQELYNQSITASAEKPDDADANTRPPAYVYMNSKEKVEMEAVDKMEHAGLKFADPNAKKNGF